MERKAVYDGNMGLPVYRSFLELVTMAGLGHETGDWTVLEIGAANGWYGELLRLAGIGCAYEASDYSEAFKANACRLWPGLAYTVADACALPFWNGSKDIVISGGVILHVEDWRKAISEAARVAKSSVLLARTPISIHQPTALFEKTAYGVRCLEWRFQEKDIEEAIGRSELAVSATRTIFGDASYAHVSYLLKKVR